MEWDMVIENWIELWEEVQEILELEEYAPYLTSQLLLIEPNVLDAAELRAWLFEIYTICKDKDSYKVVNKQTIWYKNHILPTLCEEGIIIKENVFRQKDNWLWLLAS